MSLSGQECTGYVWGVLEGTVCVCVHDCAGADIAASVAPAAAAVSYQSECCPAALSQIAALLCSLSLCWMALR